LDPVGTMSSAGPRCLGYFPNPLPPRSLKLLHGVQWQTSKKGKAAKSSPKVTVGPGD
jgi:hypothetical protein